MVWWNILDTLLFNNYLMKISMTATWIGCWHDSIIGEVQKLIQPQLMLINDIVCVSWLTEQVLGKVHKTISEAVSSKSVTGSSLISSCSIVSVSCIKFQKARLSKFQKIKLRIMIYSVKWNHTIDYMIRIYYFHELEYWIKNLENKI